MRIMSIAQGTMREQARRQRTSKHLVATCAHPKGPVIHTGDQNPHVILIDDTQEILDLLRELFEDDGYRVLVSRETDELPQLRDLLPEVIVQEILAGGRPEAGWQFLTLTRREPDQAHASLVLCTAAASTV